MSAGNVKKYVKNKGYESINRNMLQDVEHLSIEAIGLLSHLTSYSENWKLYKTELYTRFKKSKRTKIQTAWNELVEENYIVQLRKRNGKQYDYIYYHSQERFTEEEKLEIAKSEGAELWDGKMDKPKKEEPKKEKPAKKEDAPKPHDDKDVSTVENQQSNFNSPKSTPKKLTMNEVHYKEINYNNLNPNPMALITELDLPLQIKEKVRVKIHENKLPISSNQILEIEEAYNYQLAKGYLEPEAGKKHDKLNDSDFAYSVGKMLETVDLDKIDSLRAMIDSWCEKALIHKFGQNRGF